MGGGEILAGIVRADRQLPVPAVDKDGELDAARAAAGKDGLDRGARRAPGIDDVVDEDDDLIRHVKGELRALDNGRVGQEGEIVPVKADIQTAAGNGAALDAPDIVADALGDRLAPAADADEDNVFHAAVLLDDLMGDAHERAAKRDLVHDLGLELHK